MAAKVDVPARCADPREGGAVLACQLRLVDRCSDEGVPQVAIERQRGGQDDESHYEDQRDESRHANATGREPWPAEEPSLLLGDRGAKMLRAEGKVPGRELAQRRDRVVGLHRVSVSSTLAVPPSSCPLSGSSSRRC